VPVLETTLSSTATDSGVHLSVDGLTLHFSANLGGGATYEIYSATRPSLTGAWTPPVLVSVSDPTVVDDQPFLSADGLELYFGSTNRAGGVGSIDIWKAVRPNVAAPWGQPTNVTELNSTLVETSFSMTADGLECYFLTTGWGNPSGNNNTIYRATRAATALPFGTPVIVPEFSTANTHRDVEVSPDGLTIVFTEFFSPRTRVMFASRTSRSQPFAPPVALSEFDTVGTSIGVFSFTRSSNGNEAFLSAGFAAASGGQQILSTKFEGLTHSGIAGGSSAMTLWYRDTPSSGLVYVMGAALGNTGFALGTRQVPLDPDFLLVATLGTSVPPWTTGFAGVLNGSGQGSATVGNPGGMLTGLQVYVGAFTFDPAAPQGVRTVSNSFPLLFQ
jgi:hypothetical protein